MSAIERIIAIEEERKAAGITQAALALAAGISLRTYSRLFSHDDSPSLARQKLSATCTNIERAEQALIRMNAYTEEKRSDANLILLAYRSFLFALASDFGVTVDDVDATDPRSGATADPHWRACAHARQAAIYLTNTALGLRQRRLAEVLGLTPAAVCLALKAVEDRRDDPAFDAALRRAAKTITGRDDE